MKRSVHVREAANGFGVAPIELRYAEYVKTHHGAKWDRTCKQLHARIFHSREFRLCRQHARARLREARRMHEQGGVMRDIASRMLEGVAATWDTATMHYRRWLAECAGVSWDGDPWFGIGMEMLDDDSRFQPNGSERVRRLRDAARARSRSGFPHGPPHGSQVHSSGGGGGRGAPVPSGDGPLSSASRHDV